MQFRQSQSGDLPADAILSTFTPHDDIIDASSDVDSPAGGVGSSHEASLPIDLILPPLSSSQSPNNPTSATVPADSEAVSPSNHPSSTHAGEGNMLFVEWVDAFGMLSLYFFL